MREEIATQPEALARLLAKGSDHIAAVAGSLRKRRPRVAILVARGTSDNAATLGRYLFEYVAGLPAALAAPSIATLYRRPVRLRGAVVIGVSQSGTGGEVAEYVSRSRSLGAATIAVTNHPGSPLARAAEFVIPIHAGREVAVAATKTYLCSVLALYLLAAHLAEARSLLRRLEQVPEVAASALEVTPHIQETAERYRYLGECMVLGRGLNYATCREVALKISETSYVVAEGMSVADFMHGPIAAVDRGFPVVLFASQGPSLRGVMPAVKALVKRQAEVIAISNSRPVLGAATIAFPVAESVEELLTPFPFAVAGQLFAWHLAMVKGEDPDRPRGLAKVTRTT